MWKNFLSLLYPSSCLICNRVLHVPENLLCLTCYSDLPKTPLKHSILDNSTTTDFSGSLALFEYNHSGIKKLIHQLKFEGNYKNLYSKYLANLEYFRNFWKSTIHCGENELQDEFEISEILSPLPLVASNFFSALFLLLDTTDQAPSKILWVDR